MDENKGNNNKDTETVNSDFSFVNTTARIAILDDLNSKPRIIDINPAPTIDFIGSLASSIYTEASQLGGKIGYTIIRQVTENLIHAKFKEITITIMPGGNTIKFADQGPGIEDKEKALQPGFSSASHDMKKYIDGVGAGLPIALEYLKNSHGSLNIEDNMNSGTVITLSLDNIAKDEKEETQSTTPSPLEALLEDVSKRGKEIIVFLSKNDLQGVSDISNTLHLPPSTTHLELSKLENLNIVTKIGKKRTLTNIGTQIANTLK